MHGHITFKLDASACPLVQKVVTYLSNGVEPQVSFLGSPSQGQHREGYRQCLIHTFLFFPLFFFFFFKKNFILFIFGCVGSSFLCKGFLQLGQTWATHYRGLSCCGAQAPDVQAQQLWLTGPVAPRHVGSSQTRTQTRVPCIGRQILNHCVTREAPPFCLKSDQFLFILIHSFLNILSFVKLNDMISIDIYTDIVLQI